MYLNEAAKREQVIFKEIMAENILELMKNMNPENLELQQIPSRKNKKEIHT